MKGDFTRLRFDPEGKDAAWLQQQGRIGLDSDHNEAELARLNDLELRTADLVGRAARPDPGTAFLIGAGPSDDDVAIGGGPGPGGHLYVDGILCRNPQPTTYLTQPDLPGPPPLPLPHTAVASWSSTPDLRSARSRHASVVLDDGTVLAIGGTNSGAPIATVERYNPATGTWTPVRSMMVARLDHAAILLANGRVLVTGGRGTGNLTLGSTEIYDPSTDTWTATGPLRTSRAQFTLTLLATGEVAAIGGVNFFINTFGPTRNIALSSVERFEPASGTWLAATDMSQARYSHTTVRLTGAGTDHLLVAGGVGSFDNLAAAEIYDPVANEWTAARPMSEARADHTATRLADGTVLVTGGAGSGTQTAPSAPLGSAELYHPAINRWTVTAPMFTPRLGHTATLLVQGQVLVAGGGGGTRSDEPAALGTAELWDPQTQTWARTPSMATPRLFHTAVLDTDQRVLVVGGTTTTGQQTAAPSEALAGTLTGTETATAELFDPGQSAYAVAYVDAWRRLVTYLQDDFREVALSGTDTTARLRTVAQVKIAPVPINHRPAALDCTHARAYLPRPGGGRLTTVLTDTTPTGNGCDLPDSGGYTGRDNRLYRVEMHRGGEIIGAVAPADIALQLDATAGSTTITVTSLGGGRAALLGQGRWDISDGTGSTAEALLIDRVDAASDTVTLALPLRNSYAADEGATLTRQRDPIRLGSAVNAGAQTFTVDPAVAPALGTAAGALGVAWYVRGGNRFEPVTVTAVDAGSGLVTIDGPLLNAYPIGSELVARGSFVWSRDNAAFSVGVTKVQQVDPSVPQMVLEVDGLGRDQASALRLGDLVELIGDADELGRGSGLLCRVATDPDPDQLLVTVDAADPAFATLDPDAHLVLRRWDGFGLLGTDQVDLGLGVGISFTGGDFHTGDHWWFTARVNGNQIEQLTAAPPNGPDHHTAPLAVLTWGPDLDDPGRLTLTARDCVQRIGTLGEITAAQVSYDDTKTALGTNVQDALDKLGANANLPHVVEGGVNWENDRELPINALNDGLTVTFSEPMHPDTFSDTSVRVYFDMPIQPDGQYQVYHLPYHLTGFYSVDDTTLTFKPRTPVTEFELDAAFNLERWNTGLQRLRVHVVLKGSMILDLAGGRQLDGAVSVRPTETSGGDTVMRLRLPSGNGTAGSDFESWFYLVATDEPIVQAIDPPDDAELDSFPPAIMLIFGTEVLTSTVTSQTFTVVDPNGRPVPGDIQPYPFTDSGTSSRMTFVGIPGNRYPAGQYTVSVLGSGEGQIGDTSGRSLRDFFSTFTVTPPGNA